MRSQPCISGRTIVFGIEFYLVGRFSTGSLCTEGSDAEMCMHTHSLICNIYIYIFIYIYICIYIYIYTYIHTHTHINMHALWRCSCNRAHKNACTYRWQAPKQAMAWHLRQSCGTRNMQAKPRGLTPHVRHA